MPLTATTLAGDVLAGDVSLTVTDALGFPSSSASGPFKVLIDTEEISVSAGYGTTTWSSLTRGEDGTTAADHAAGTAVYLVPEAYASLADILATFDTPPGDSAAKLGALSDYLGVASNEIAQEVGFDFYRHPVTGTETRTLRGSGGSRLHLHGLLPGLAEAPTLIEFLDVWAGTATTVQAADYELEQLDPASGQYDHVYLGGTASGFSRFPDGRRLVRITGAFGFPAIPDAVRKGTIDRAKQLYNADPSMQGGIVGPDEYQSPVVLPRLPDTTYRVIEHYRRRYATCLGG